MAYIRTTDNHYVKVTPEQGNRIWLLLNNELQPKDQAESDKLDRVEKVILNKQNPSTPLSYLLVHPTGMPLSALFVIVLWLVWTN